VIGLVRFLRNAPSKDPERRLRALRQIADRMVPVYRLTLCQLEWWQDEGFNAYLDRFGFRDSFHVHHRWMVWQLMRLVWEVKGDTAEWGVLAGGASWLICTANQGTGRVHHLFDSFEGLSAPGPNDGSYWKAGAMSAGEDIVRRKLKPFANSLVFHKGWIPERFPDVADKTFAFTHIDVDLHQPTLDSVEFFYPRLAPGGIMLCDDYALTTHPGATEAIDNFLRDKPEKMIWMDAGGGFLINGLATGSGKLPLMPAGNG
jgi:O-methyltransferase